MPDLFELAAATRELDNHVEELTNAVQVNTTRLDAAMDRIDAHNRRIERAEGLITRTWVFLAAVVLLAGLLGVLLFRQTVTEDRLNQVVAAEHDARAKFACPLLAVFIGSYDPNSRLEGEARQRYEDAFVKFRQSYADLNCAALAPVVPGRGQSVPPSSPPAPPPVTSTPAPR